MNNYTDNWKENYNKRLLYLNQNIATSILVLTTSTIALSVGCYDMLSNGVVLMQQITAVGAIGLISLSSIHMMNNIAKKKELKTINNLLAEQKEIKQKTNSIDAKSKLKEDQIFDLNNLDKYSLSDLKRIRDNLNQSRELDNNPEVDVEKEKCLVKSRKVSK